MIKLNQCVLPTTFQLLNDIGRNYLNEVFQWATESNRTLRNHSCKLKHPFYKTTANQISFFEEGLQNGINFYESKKKLNNNIFKHNVKKLLLAQLTN